MTGAQRRALLLTAVAILAASALAFTEIRPGPTPLPPRPPSQQPNLLLLTSLPLVFSEDFSLRGGGSPALKKLEARYRVVPISVTERPDLAKGNLLLMAQPQAQPAQSLVTLDEWVRGGGRVLLLADPMLEWPSKRPLGDPLRPSPMFADTGLLAHWGLRLDAPDERGLAMRQLGEYRVATVSPGTLRGSCAIAPDRLAAHCKVGKGMVTVVADADLLNIGDIGVEANHNLDGLIEELARIESK